MPDRTSYATLKASAGYLQGVELQAEADQGITKEDLLEAERKAKTKIDDWILDVAGAVRGAAIVAEFTDDANDVDRAITDLAEIIAAAYVLELWHQRNFGKQPQGEQPQPKPYYETMQEKATAVAQGIKRSGKTMKTDGTVRRWRWSAREAGPVVGGPMSSGSLFDDGGLYTDQQGRTFQLPHRHPLWDATS